MLQTPLAKISTLVALAIVIWAVSGGRTPERISAVAVGIDWALGVLFQDHRPRHHIQAVIFLLDITQAAFLLVVAASWRRTWSLWAAAFALLLVLMHMTMWLDVRLMQWSYLTASYVWSFGLLAALGLGTGFERTPPASLVGWRGWARS